MFNKLFKWNEVDLLDNHLIFMDCTLIQGMGVHPGGSQFLSINIDMVNGILSLEGYLSQCSESYGVIDRFDLVAELGKCRYDNISSDFGSVQSS